MEAVIVTSNSADDLIHLFECIPLRRAFQRFVVVDNGSTDSSQEIAVSAGATVIERDTRLGFGTAANLGIRATQGPLVALLNPDIRIQGAEDITRLSQAFINRRVGAVAPALILPDGRIQDSARRVPTPVELLLRRRLHPDRGAIRRRGPVPWVVGACLVLRREAFEEVGGFDDGYPLYFEDVDLCTRLWRAGWQVLYEPSVEVQHVHKAASRKTLHGRATRMHARSAARFYRRNPRHLLSRGWPPTA